MFYTLYNAICFRIKKIIKRDIYSLAEKGEINRNDTVINIR
jgi:hypothetical protein